MGVWRLPFSLATALHHLAEFMFSGKVTNCVFLVTRPWVHSPVLTSSLSLHQTQKAEGTVDV